MDRWEQFGKLVKEIGFPIFVALYLLWQITPTLQRIEQSLVVVNETQRLLQQQLIFKGIVDPNNRGPR